jgi:adenine-specific DNA-methyltransferase
LSRLNDLIRQVGLTNEVLAADLQREVAALADRRSFGLNFERHVPEAVELPGRPVRRGDKVRILPPRGNTPKQTDEKLWQVAKIDRTGDSPVAELVALGDETEAVTTAVEDLVVVAEFRDPIYPGLVSTGKVERGGDKPFHTVVNAENYHALQALLFTHRGKVDCIYIDPPYNTGAKDWKYNNDYVEGDDLYRHSKWLAFMERRLLLAKELLNPDDSVLIVTIDEKECSRLGLLLEQTFPDATIQMASIVTNPSGSVRPGRLARTDEYAYFIFVGDGELSPQYVAGIGKSASGPLPKVWETAIRSGAGTGVRPSRPNLFYPVFIEPESLSVHSVGDPVGLLTDRREVPAPYGTVAIWPIGQENREQTWAFSHINMRTRLSDGTARVANGKRGPSVLYLQAGVLKKIDNGTFKVLGRRADGALDLGWGDNVQGRPDFPRSTWNSPSHSASSGGTRLLSSILPGRSFPYPKSLYAVEDTLRYVVADNPDAIVLDFFAGSGTTAHALMRLNRQDGGRRQCLSVTNNEASADEQSRLRAGGLRPGQAEWEAHGICDHITQPRIAAAITGKTPAGEPIRGNYKFTDEFPMSDGFEENVEFFVLTYEAPLRVASHRDFERISPLLWLRAGSRGRRIEDLTKGWDVAEAYGVLADLDRVEPFVQAVVKQVGLELAFIVTDEDRLFETVVRELPEHVEPVRLYEAYLRNFEIESGRGLR